MTRVYRLVVDQPATQPYGDCWRCGYELEDGATICSVCNADLSPARIGGRRRNFMTPRPAEWRVRLIRQHGGQAHVEVSDPVTFPADR